MPVEAVVFRHRPWAWEQPCSKVPLAVTIRLSKIDHRPAPVVMIATPQSGNPAIPLKIGLTSLPTHRIPAAAMVVLCRMPETEQVSRCSAPGSRCPYWPLRWRRTVKLQSEANSVRFFNDKKIRQLNSLCYGPPRPGIAGWRACSQVQQSAMLKPNSKSSRRAAEGAALCDAMQPSAGTSDACEARGASRVPVGGTRRTRPNYEAKPIRAFVFNKTFIPREHARPQPMIQL
jgi:hypothetical protein